MKREIEKTLRKTFESWLKDQPAEGAGREWDVLVGVAPDNVPGDLASNLALTAGKIFRRPSRDVAREILERWPGDQPVVSQTEVAGPGYLNFTLSSPWMYGELRSLLADRRAYGRRAPEGGGSLLVEFVSANPTGPLHVGHGRGAALGDFLARLFAHLGWKVQTEYYVNDMGTQMENLGTSIMVRCRELDPAYLSEEEAAAASAKTEKDLYKGDYIRDIARDLMERHPAGSGRPRGTGFFLKAGIDSILGGIRRDLADFHVNFDSWFAESELTREGRVEKTLDALRRGGHVKEEDGALWFLSTRHGDDKDRVLKRQDERPTYFASDLAYHDLKFERGFEKMIDIWGTDHHGYAPRLRAGVEALGRDPGKLTILLYQLVSLVRGGKPVAMSTRAGEFVTLRQVMDEVGTDACRFFFALRGPNSQLDFDLDLAKRQAPENPVFYAQYVHARCCSIFREAEKRGVAPGAERNFSPPQALDPSERALLVKIVSFPDVLEQCRADLSPHPLTNYLLSLAKDFHRFYENCRVLGEPDAVTAFRLALVDGVRAQMANGLSLLGVSAPENM